MSSAGRQTAGCVQPFTPQELVARCVAGDDAAKAAFITEFGDLVHRAVAAKLAALSARPAIRADVEDIRNDLFARLLADDCRLMRQLRAPERIKAWLVAVTRNHVVDYVRRWSTRLRAQDLVLSQESRLECAAASVGRDPAETAIARETEAHLRQRVAALSPPQRLAIELFYTHNLRYAEIAEITGENINTVASRLRRAKARLRRELEAMDEPRPCGSTKESRK